MYRYSRRVQTAIIASNEMASRRMALMSDDEFIQWVAMMYADTPRELVVADLIGTKPPTDEYKSFIGRILAVIDENRAKRMRNRPCACGESQDGSFCKRSSSPLTNSGRSTPSAAAYCRKTRMSIRLSPRS